MHKVAVPLHPILFATAFVLNTSLASEAAPSTFARSLVVVLVVATALVVLVGAFSKNWPAAGLVASAVILVIMSRGPLASVLGTLISLTGEPVLSVGLITILICVVLGGGGMFAIRQRMNGQRIPIQVTHATNLGAALLLFVVVLSHTPRLAAYLHQTENLSGAACGPAAEPDAPDIYLLLLDGYPRQDTLAERLGFDNQEFLRALEHRGFDVASESHSNYNWTALTLASMLNMRYLDAIPSLGQAIGQEGQHVAELREAAENGEVFSVARDAGLAISIVPSSWQHVDLRAAADRVLDGGQLNELERDLILRTWLPEILWLFDDGLFAAQERSRVLQVLADASLSPPEGERGFVFAHVPLPHHPILFGRGGSAASPRTMRAFRDAELVGRTPGEQETSYVEQLDFLNEEVLRAVDSMLQPKADDRSEPLIIVMSDHGSPFGAGGFDPHDRFSNLFASYSPGNADLFEETATPVNVFRRVFDAYFGTCYGDVPDLYYATPDYNKILVLQQLRDPDARRLSPS